jgi:hypothetical protein
MPKATLSLLILPALIAAGCPVYDDGCYSDSDCGPGYLCEIPSGLCVREKPEGPARCDEPRDCPLLAPTCDRFGRCTELGCAQAGCVDGYECVESGGGERCRPETPGSAGAEAGGATGEGGATDGGATSGGAGGR